MAEERKSFSSTLMNFFSAFKGMRQTVVLSICVVVCVLMMILPLPTPLLDFLMILNIALSLVILLLALNVKRAIDFDVFPTMLLLSTIFGLGLNISSTRLILTQGAEFDGRIVRMFSTFVTGSGGTVGLGVGFIMFAILMIVQLVVITKGATRSAEVRARFKLDSMQIDKMDVTNEFAQGHITESEYKRRKKDLQRSVDLFGTLDGASKFVSGNVKAGLVITVINVVGGLIVGVFLHGESWSGAFSNYIGLAIGDGLVSQLPALLVSVASGIIITKGESEDGFPADVSKQFRVNPIMYIIIGALLFLMALIPGFPWYILIPVALGLFYIAYRVWQQDSQADSSDGSNETPESAAGGSQQEQEVVQPLDPISVEIGYGLVPLVSSGTEKKTELLDRIRSLRSEFLNEFGLYIPKVRVKDNLSMDPNEYRIKIYGNPYGKGQMKYGYLLAIGSSSDGQEILGEKTVEPSFQLPAVWINSDQIAEAEQKGYTVVDCSTAIVTHLSEILKRHAADLLTLQQVQNLLESIKQDNAAAYDKIISRPVSLTLIQKVFRNLISEGVSIRNVGGIAEAILTYIDLFGDNADYLSEKVRQSLGPQLTQKYLDQDDVLNCITLSPDFQNYLLRLYMENNSFEIKHLIPIPVMSRFMTALQNTVADVTARGYFPLILTTADLRRVIRSLLGKDFSSIPVLSISEAGDLKMIEIARISIDLKEALE